MSTRYERVLSLLSETEGLSQPQVQAAHIAKYGEKFKGNLGGYLVAMHRQGLIRRSGITGVYTYYKVKADAKKAG